MSEWQASTRGETRPQQCTRTPSPAHSEERLRPGDWVRLGQSAGPELWTRVRRIKSLTCSITSRDQKAARWLIHLEPSGCCEPGGVERLATAAEIQRAQANGGTGR